MASSYKLNYRRAVIFTLLALALIILYRTTREDPEPLIPRNPYSPSAIGTYDEARKALDWTPPQKPTQTIRNAAAEATKAAARKIERPQLPIEELLAQPLRKQLAYMYPYDAESRFPAYIWQTWRKSPSDGSFDENLRPMEASWSVLHPTFVHEVITDDVARHLVRHLYATVPEVYLAYEALPKVVLKADFFRYLILLARGGIYTDIDTMALKSAIDWVPENVPRSQYGLVVGIEADPDRPDWRNWYARRIQFCQWTIQSKPGHPVLVDVVATIVEEVTRRKAEGTLNKVTGKDVIEFTGPAMWTDALFSYFNDPEYFDMTSSTKNITYADFTGIEEAKRVGDVVVLPITSFSPGVGQMGAKEDDDPMAFVRHNFDGMIG